jgi:hypothetical protein
MRSNTLTLDHGTKLQQNKGISRLMGIGFLEEDYSSEWSSMFPKFSIPHKTEQ